MKRDTHSAHLSALPVPDRLPPAFRIEVAVDALELHELVGLRDLPLEDLLRLLLRERDAVEPVRVVDVTGDDLFGEHVVPT